MVRVFIILGAFFSIFVFFYFFGVDSIFFIDFLRVLGYFLLGVYLRVGSFFSVFLGRFRFGDRRLVFA